MRSHISSTPAIVLHSQNKLLCSANCLHFYMFRKFSCLPVSHNSLDCTIQPVLRILILCVRWEVSSCPTHGIRMPCCNVRRSARSKDNALDNGTTKRVKVQTLGDAQHYNVTLLRRVNAQRVNIKCVFIVYLTQIFIDIQF